MASSKKWAFLISSIASFILFFIIIFQLPLFRVPCRIGICTSPIEVTSSQLIATELCPAFVVKALLYPGAISKASIKNQTLPTFDNLLKLYSLTNFKKGSAKFDLHHLEILAGSYLTVAGAVFGVIRQGRMSLFGTLLIIWGIIREGIQRKSATKAFHIYPEMYIALVCAFLSIRKDVKKLFRSSKARKVVKSLGSKAKYM
ncbi:hypothetical protein JCGZ_06171 [Jatropha curcas]|uniref:Uncharacterized protein n=1 Tax=Jatropha curcas TaxID=180498 RepID=A0A067KXW8_JATCU|nr:uncharacterized protein LOC105634884 [Jatropha curcas]KDP37115.1 hypothetical protein JCGZ_06171 [Jatropha curcas]